MITLNNLQTVRRRHDRGSPFCGKETFASLYASERMFLGKSTAQDARTSVVDPSNSKFHYVSPYEDT
jgi:hypothetical protein